MKRPRRRARARPGRRRPRAGASREGLVPGERLARPRVGGRAGGGGLVTLRVRIDAGPLLLPRFEGNEHYDADVLTAALGLDTETDRSPSHLADKIRAFYEKRGFLDVEVRAEVRGGDESGQARSSSTSTSTRACASSARRYPCLKLDAIKNLSAGGPRSSAAIGTEIDSFLEEELPGADLFVDPDPRGVERDDRRPGGRRTAARGRQRAPCPSSSTRTPRTSPTPTTAPSSTCRSSTRTRGSSTPRSGPIGIVRARCDPRAPPGPLRPAAAPAARRPRCASTTRPGCRSRRSRSTRRSRAAPTRRTASSARRRSSSSSR